MGGATSDGSVVAESSASIEDGCTCCSDRGRAWVLFIVTTSSHDQVGGSILSYNRVVYYRNILWS